MNWTLLGWLFFAAATVKLFTGSYSVTTIAISLGCLAVGDILKAIKAAKEGK